MARRRRRRRIGNPYVLARRVGRKRRRVSTRAYSSRRRALSALRRGGKRLGVRVVKVRRARRPGMIVRGKVVRMNNAPISKGQKRALRAILRSHAGHACKCKRRRRARR